jgi:hypothetical protein
VGEISFGTDGNWVNWRDLLQNEAPLSAHDIHSFALSGLLHQSPQIGLGAAETETVGLEIESASSMGTIRNFHNLIIACS